MDSAVPQSAPRSGTVGVYAAQGELRALAARDIGAGEAFFDLQGWVVPEPTRYTIQLGPGSHLEMPAGVPWEIVLRDYPWRFLNHSCVPNTRIVGRQSEPCDPEALAGGKEVAYHYREATTEQLTVTMSARMIDGAPASAVMLSASSPGAGVAACSNTWPPETRKAAMEEKSTERT